MQISSTLTIFNIKRARAATRAGRTSIRFYKFSSCLWSIIISLSLSLSFFISLIPFSLFLSFSLRVRVCKYVCALLGKLSFMYFYWRRASRLLLATERFHHYVFRYIIEIMASRTTVLNNNNNNNSTTRNAHSRLLRA